MIKSFKQLLVIALALVVISGAAFLRLTWRTSMNQTLNMA